MTLKKITSLTVLVLGSLVMTISCEENTDIKKNGGTPSQVSGRILNYTFDGTEGDAITLDVAVSWFANYTLKNITAVKSQFFGANTIRKILATSNVMGIRIYYSIDDAGNKQLLLIGADGRGSDQSPRSGAKGIASSLDLGGGVVDDSFTGAEEAFVPEDVFVRWTTNYNTQNPQGLIAHFFGFEILNQILNQNGCIGIRMYYALNNSGVQQVLLVGVNTDGSNILPSLQNGGRVADGGGTVADASYPCPSYCN